MIAIKPLCGFETGVRFEPFLALQTFADPESRIHGEWKKAAQKRLPAAFHKKHRMLGGSPFLWPVVADAPRNLPLSASFAEVLESIASLPPDVLQESVISETLHEERVVSAVLSRKIDLPQAISRVSGTKKEWLTFIGLYPVSQASGLLNGLQLLLRAPRDFQQIVCETLSLFWKHDFKETWAGLKDRLSQSAEEKQRLFESCTFAEFAKLALLRIEVDEPGNTLRAVRGGWTLAFKDIASVSFLPSAFNDKRHWTCYPDGNRYHVYFPYFDPSVSLKRAEAVEGPGPAQPELDPALILRALGDTTRYGMAALLARQPSTSADLARTLSLSRPTVSHHIHVLREAGLLIEKPHGTTIQLALNRDVLEKLSDLVVARLFEAGKKVELKKTRKK